MNTASERCLFSAPHDFFADLLTRTPCEVVPQVVWERSDLKPDSTVTAWITNTGWRFRLEEQDLDLFPNLKVVVTPSTGRDHIDVAALERRGIAFYSLLDDREGLEQIASSAEFAFLLLLNTLRRLPVAVDGALRGLWRRDDEDLFRGRELQGRRVGLVGLGRIGRRLMRYCCAFGAEVGWYDPHVEAPGHRHPTLASLFANSDSVVVCCTYDPGTEGLISGELISLLPPNATLVNIARGEVLVEVEVAEVLAKRSDLCVGLDVLAGEPQGRQFDSPLVPLQGLGRVVITPHIGGSSYESQSKAARIALGLVEQGLAAVSQNHSARIVRDGDAGRG